MVREISPTEFHKSALAAGGRLVSDHAPTWWVLADPEGNEACVTSIEGRG